MKLSVLIPAYNEQENVKRFKGELIPAVNDVENKYGLSTEVVLVNDGSTDGTLDAMNELTKKDKRIKVVSYMPNRGIGCAICAGIKHLNSDYTVMLDADLTFHPREIPLLMDALGQADVICGSPFMEGGNTNVPFYRTILTGGVAWMYTAILGKKVRAITPIFKLYKTQDIKELQLESKGFTICAEILSKLVFKKKTIKEVPVTLTTRIHGESKMKFSKEIKNNLKMMGKMIGWRM